MIVNHEMKLAKIGATNVGLNKNATLKKEERFEELGCDQRDDFEQSCYRDGREPEGYVRMGKRQKLTLTSRQARRLKAGIHVGSFLFGETLPPPHVLASLAASRKEINFAHC